MIEDNFVEFVLIKMINHILFVCASVRPLTFSNDFSSEATEPILLKFHMEPSKGGGMGKIAKMVAVR